MEKDVQAFFDLVKKLPKLQAFTASLFNAISKPALWQPIVTLKNLREVSIPWEDEAIKQLAIHNPEIEEIGFPVLREGAISSQGIKALSSFKSLKKINVALTEPSQAVVDVLEHASEGFLQLKAMSFQYHNHQVMAALTRNFAKFNSLTELGLAGIEEESLMNFLKSVRNTKGKLIALRITPFGELQNLDSRIQALRAFAIA